MPKAFIACAAAALCCVAHAGTIDIQKIRLGMTHAELAAAHPRGVARGISVAGASSRHGFVPPSVRFIDGRLDQFSAYFAARDFDRIRDALVARNATLRCTAQARGIPVCFDDEGTFVLTRAGGMTMLLLQTRERAEQAERALAGLRAEGEKTAEAGPAGGDSLRQGD